MKWRVDWWAWTLIACAGIGLGLLALGQPRLARLPLWFAVGWMVGLWLSQRRQQ